MPVKQRDRVLKNTIRNFYNITDEYEHLKETLVIKIDKVEMPGSSTKRTTRVKKHRYAWEQFQNARRERSQRNENQETPRDRVESHTKNDFRIRNDMSTSSRGGSFNTSNHYESNQAHEAKSTG